MLGSSPAQVAKPKLVEAAEEPFKEERQDKPPLKPEESLRSPSEEAVAHAHRVIAAFEEGDSGLVVLDNKLIEKPVLRTMYRTVRVAEKIAAG